MNISSVSSSVNGMASSSGSDNEVKQLEKEKANLQKELQQENVSKDDTKTKEVKTKEIQLEIQQIDAKIQQLKSEKTGQKQSANSGSSIDALKALKSTEQNDGRKTEADKKKALLKDPVRGNNIDEQV